MPQRIPFKQFIFFTIHLQQRFKLRIGNHLSSMVFKKVDFFDFPSVLVSGNTFQNLNVSSPAPVTIVCPDGFIAKNNTRLVWPVRVVTFYKLGYFHTMISLFEYPCVDTNSFVVFENIKLQT